MRTPSHLLIGAAINTAIPQEQRCTSALLFGSILPDLPFTILTFFYTIYYQFWGTVPSDVSTMEYLHFDVFFRDPIWIVSHNFFHSLVIGLVLLAVGYLQRNTYWGKWLMWLMVGTLIHTVIDIFTHHIDGPLFLFPLSWTYRFESPISYWEAEYYGQQFRVFEYLFDGLLLIYLVRHWWQKRSLNTEK